MTGWPAGLMQDDSRELSRWLSSRLDARHVVRMNCKEMMMMKKSCCNQNCNQGRACPAPIDPAPVWVVATITALCSVWVLAGIYLLAH